MAQIEELYNAILKGNRKIVQEQVQAAVAGGMSPQEILFESMVPAIREIGDRFSRGQAFVPEMLIGARAMQAGVQILQPLMDKAGMKSLGKVAIGTVKGDLHDIGKNLVAMMVKSAGYEVIDLGVDVPVEKFEDCVKNSNVDVLMLSALLTTTMPYIKTVVDHLKGQGLKCRILIGGAPVTQAYCNQIGADGYSPDANQALGLVEGFFQKAS